MKYSNFIIFFVLLGLGILLKNSINLSTNLLSLFANKEAIHKLGIADKLGYSKEMLVAVKGFDDNSKQKVKSLVEQFKKLDNIKNVQSNFLPSKEILTYYKTHYPFLSDFNNTKLSDYDIKLKVKELYDSLFSNVFYTPIDKNDPLKLFHLNGDINKDDFIKLGSYGYLIKITTDIAPSQMGEAKSLYNRVDEIVGYDENIVAFAPFFYTVENSQKIKSDVRYIVFISALILLLIYYLLLKNIKLLVHTLVALGSSMIFAILVSSMILESLHVIALAFGMTITAVSIDYLLHYYFHDFYMSEKKVDKNVMFGFLTTALAFSIFAFIPVTIISQISLFCVLSLLFAYLLFTFIFPYLEIKEYHCEIKEMESKKTIPSYIFIISSLLLLTYSFSTIKIDNNLRNLDYQNAKLQAKEKLFKDSMKNSLIPILVEADSKEKLISNLHKIQDKYKDSFSLANFVLSDEKCKQRERNLKEYDFKSLKKLINIEALELGFKKNYFKNSYDFVESSICKVEDFKIFENYNLYFYEEDSHFYSLAYVSDLNLIKEFNFTQSLSIKDIFAEVSKEIFSSLLIYSSFVVLSILLLMFFVVKNRFVYALNYILFPISLTLAVVGCFYELNIMHIFALVILVAIGIDFGIYMSNSKQISTTTLAIKYSLLSTFGAFGVLIFSSVVALNSIGFVVSVGIVAIYILIRVMK